MLRLLCLPLLLVSCVSTTPTKKRSSSSNLIQQGNEYARGGLLREAVDVYQKELRKNPKNKLAERNLGITYVRLGSYKRAVKHLEKIIANFENDFETNFYLAESLRATEKFAEAIFRYRQSLKIRKHDLKSMKALAWSYFKIRYYTEAFEVAQKMHKFAPEDGQVAIISARILLKLQKPKSALKIIRKGKRKAGKDSTPYFESVEGDVLRSMEMCTSAIKVYKAALKVQPLLAGSLYGLGRCYMDQGNMGDAIEYMERAVRLRPKFIEALYLLGKAYQQVGKHSKAIVSFKKFRKLASRDPEFLNKIPEVKQSISLMRKKIRSAKRARKQNDINENSNKRRN